MAEGFGAAARDFRPWRCRGTRDGHRCRTVLGEIVGGVLRFEHAVGAVAPGGTVALVCPACGFPNLWTPGTPDRAPMVR